MQKFDKRHDNIISFFVIVLVLSGFIGASELASRRQKHAGYEPGKSLNRKERMEVNAMNDSTLNSRIATYNLMRRDYNQMLNNSHERNKEKFNSFELNKAGLPRFFNDNDTIRKQDEMMRKFERDSIEARYQQLQRQIAQKRQKQK